MIDKTIELRNGTQVRLCGEDLFRCRAMINAGRGEVAHFLLVGTIESSERDDVAMRVLFEIEIQSQSAAVRSKCLYEFIDFLIRIVSDVLGMESKDDADKPWTEYHWRAISLSQL